MSAVHRAAPGAHRRVPYARPPIGDLRFAAPQPIRDGDGPGALTLNVFTPGGGGFPVMVWIPGGGYQIGSADLPEFDGARLAAHGVVVVTVNYRLGLEGFGQLEDAPPNRGLLDQIAALEWVRQHIADFGGDPDQVTVFGQSAGAGSVAALLAMPAAAGLFRRAIVQSMPGTYFSPDLAADVAAACAAELGVGPTAAELQQFDTAALDAAAAAVSATIQRHQDRWGPITLRPIPFAPVVDGATLPATPWAALAAGASRDVDLVVGHTRDEHRLLSLLDGTLGRVTAAQTETALRTLAPDPTAFRAAFPEASPEQLYDTVHSDWLFRMPSLHLARAHTGRTYLYELTWPAPGIGGMLGSCHGLDVPLTFGNLTSGDPAMLIGDDTAAAEQVSSQLRTAWTAFARTGGPGWPAYDRDHQLTRILDLSGKTDRYPEQVSQQLWQDHHFAPLPLLSRAGPRAR